MDDTTSDRAPRWSLRRAAMALPLLLVIGLAADPARVAAQSTSPVGSAATGGIETQVPLPPGVGPLVETIKGVLPDRLAALPVVSTRATSIMTVRPLPDRPVPSVFWYYRGGVDIVVLRQPRPAPLAFLIAGTGSTGTSPSMQNLGRVFYSRGMHVAIIPSPTYPQFVVGASSTGVPGKMTEDAADIVRVMRLVDSRLRDEDLPITGYLLSGFSLGAMEAAFVAERAERLREFQFQKIVLINPPADLGHSIVIVDGMLDRYVERDPEAVDRFIQTVFRTFGEVYAQSPTTDLSPEVIFGTFQQLENRQDILEMLVGLAFRLSTSSLTFTTDIVTNAGYYVPADARPGITNSLTEVFKVSMQHNLDDYIDDVAAPFFAARDPAYTQARLLAEARLDYVGAYLRGNPRVGMITNADDIILAPGDLAMLRSLFGPRAMVLDVGGHGGSIGRADFMAALDRLLAP